MTPLKRNVFIGVAGFGLGVASMVGYRLAHRDAERPVATVPRDAPAQTPAAAPAAPDPLYVYKVELGNAPLRGPADALVTIVEFSGFDCPRCREVEDAVRRVADAEPQEIRIAWKHLPVSPDRRIAALAALAAARQGRFWELHDRLMQADSAIDEQTIQREAASAGLDLERFRTAMADPALEEGLESDWKQAMAFNLAGPPVIFVNGKIVLDPTPEELARRVGEAREFAKQLVVEGTPPERVYAALMRGALTHTGPIVATPADLVER